MLINCEYFYIYDRMDMLAVSTKMVNKKKSAVWYGDDKRSRRNIWLRGFAVFCDAYFYWHAVTLLPLGDCEAIYFLCPIFIAFGARIFLKEEFSKGFPLILFLVICGILMIMQPEWLINIFDDIFGNDSSPYFAAENISVLGVTELAIGCVAWSVMSLIARVTPKAHPLQFEYRNDSLQCFLIWTPIIMIINASITSSYGINLDNADSEWRFTFNDIMLCVAIGCLEFVASIFLTLGYQLGEATKVL